MIKCRQCNGLCDPADIRGGVCDDCREDADGEGSGDTTSQEKEAAGTNRTSSKKINIEREEKCNERNQDYCGRT